MRIAVADDDQEVLAQITGCLESSGHTFDTFRNGKDLLVALRRETYDVVLVDWNMPGATGPEVVQWGNDTLDQPPAFILITSRSDKADIVKGLEQGASDYIVKPESEEVILARIEAAARRHGTAGRSERFQTYGEYKIDRLNEEIEHKGERVKLTSKEFKVAALFFENLNRPLSRSYIFSQIWGNMGDIATRTLDMHVSRVRSKLELRPHNGFAIQTVFGFGYRMDAFFDDAELAEREARPVE
ncbi:response regulator transcription factor [Aurantiacibacter sp. MUD61]|uniref:response regulator transcription factor n=1 Tax=Aurantiacibacter sp. MUD61 TaxID=3009083 RepID=UPI0022F0B2DC|nr:response regulator transcription factor [Aurantiacibacter sp. MUD61]